MLGAPRDGCSWSYIHLFWTCWFCRKNFHAAKKSPKFDSTCFLWHKFSNHSETFLCQCLMRNLINLLVQFVRKRPGEICSYFLAEKTFRHCGPSRLRNLGFRYVAFKFRTFAMCKHLLDIVICILGCNIG